MQTHANVYSYCNECRVTHSKVREPLLLLLCVCVCVCVCLLGGFSQRYLGKVHHNGPQRHNLPRLQREINDGRGHWKFAF